MHRHLSILSSTEPVDGNHDGASSRHWSDLETKVIGTPVGNLLRRHVWGEHVTFKYAIPLKSLPIAITCIVPIQKVPEQSSHLAVWQHESCKWLNSSLELKVGYIYKEKSKQRQMDAENVKTFVISRRSQTTPDASPRAPRARNVTPHA